MPDWTKVLALVLLIAQVSSAPSFTERKTLADSVILIPGALSRIETYGREPCETSYASLDSQQKALLDGL